MWAPDAYEGAPTPVTGFMAAGVKAAAFGAIVRLLGSAFASPVLVFDVTGWANLLSVGAALTMTLGNLAALRQESLKRMLAYSSIAHAGYVLIGLACMTGEGFSAAMYYLAAYYFMNLGAFGFVLYFEGVNGNDEIASLEGMGFKAPLISITMVAFLISLTGLPPTVGFYGKYLLFVEGVDAGLMWLVVIAALNSVVSLFYYIRVAKALFLAAPADRPAPAQPLLVGAVAILGIGTVLLGVYTLPLQRWAERSLDLLQ